MDDNETNEREEEISRLRKQMDDQFEEIVELKQAAMVSWEFCRWGSIWV